MSEQETTWAPKPEDIPQMKRDAEAGDAIAQFNLGLSYELGDMVARDLAEAVKWYRRAAEQGMPDAQYNLGCCYFRGEGVDVD